MDIKLLSDIQFVAFPFFKKETKAHDSEIIIPSVVGS
jgi:hypothetical protein